MRRTLRLLYQSNPALTITGWIHWALLLVLLVLSQIDSRTILGINAWIKPMKFSASIAIYVWTLAWFLRYIARHTRVVRVISWGVSIGMLIEIFCVILQSARGVRSHFNTATLFDSALFTTMGILIGVNTLLALLVLVLFFVEKPAIPRAYLWGIRFGFFAFLMAGAEGVVIIVHGAHTVGAPDGGPGLPLVNWSTQHGDLRVAHLLGMHALQILPLLGYAFHRSKLPDHARLLSIILLSLAYLGVMACMLWLAWQGRPLSALCA